MSMTDPDSPSNEVRITLTHFYNEQQKNNKDISKLLGEISTSLAVLRTITEPQTGINAQLFKRILALEKKIYAIPSGAVLIGLISLAVAIFRK